MRFKLNILYTIYSMETSTLNRILCGPWEDPRLSEPAPPAFSVNGQSDDQRGGGPSDRLADRQHRMAVCADASGRLLATGPATL